MLDALTAVCKDASMLLRRTVLGVFNCHGSAIPVMVSCGRWSQCAFKFLMCCVVAAAERRPLLDGMAAPTSPAAS